MAQVRYFVAGCLVYALAWTPLCLIVAKVVGGPDDDHNSSAWANASEVGIKLPPNYVAQQAFAPAGILGFFVFTFLLFSSFGVWHLDSWAWKNPKEDRWKWLPNTELGYFGLSAVAKTSLYIFLVLTVLAQSSVGRNNELPKSRASDDKTYAIGFGLTLGVVIIVWATTRCLAKRYEPVYRRQLLLSAPASRLRWTDYVVSAPIMFAVLSVSWGCASAMLVAAGSALQAVGILLARASDPLMDRRSEAQVSPEQAVHLHRFLAAVHLGSAATFVWIAAHRKLLGLSVPLRTDWSTEPFDWYRVKPNVSSADSGAVLIMDTSNATVDFPVVLFAALFATWSGVCHVYGAGCAWGLLEHGKTQHTQTKTTNSVMTTSTVTLLTHSIM
jgi:hypothetical protein